MPTVSSRTKGLAGRLVVESATSIAAVAKLPPMRSCRRDMNPCTRFSCNKEASKSSFLCSRSSTAKDEGRGLVLGCGRKKLPLEARHNIRNNRSSKRQYLEALGHNRAIVADGTNVRAFILDCCKQIAPHRGLRLRLLPCHGQQRETMDRRIETSGGASGLTHPGCCQKPLPKRTRVCRGMLKLDVSFAVSNQTLVRRDGSIGDTNSS